MVKFTWLALAGAAALLQSYLPSLDAEDEDLLGVELFALPLATVTHETDDELATAPDAERLRREPLRVGIRLLDRLAKSRAAVLGRPDRALPDRVIGDHRQALLHVGRLAGGQEPGDDLDAHGAGSPATGEIQTAPGRHGARSLLRRGEMRPTRPCHP